MNKDTNGNGSYNEEDIKRMIEKGVKKLENMNCNDKGGIKQHAGCGASGTIWFLGFVGAAVYFIQHAASFGDGMIGLLKALVWPALLIYNLFEFLGI